MANIMEMAQSYETTTTHNIAELDVVSTSLEVKEKTFKEGTDEEFTIFVVNIDGIDYRVPKTVLADLKAILKKKPELTEFAVSKSGEGLGTTYTVIPL